MATKTCTICGKGSVMGGKRKLLRGHYNPVKWERKHPNLQWLRLPAGKAGVGKTPRVLACTTCIRKRKSA